MNVKANQRILQMEEVDELFIFPSCGDETNPIGSSLIVQAREEGVTGIEPIDVIYWGRSFTENEIMGAIQNETPNYKVERPVNLPRKVAELISNGEIVARFSGRDEFGARALGNRSILADPSRTDVIRIINDMIKNRDFWMPFACSIKSERADDYLINPKKMVSPYMIMTFDTTERRAEIAAGTHPYDGTARPQVVYRDHNQDYHQIISEFEKITGIGALLNTSFNLHGNPIVHTPQDALQVLAKYGLKFLAIGPFLVSKP
jgi:carbamoyltransferase